jgi:hypothetical protein
MYVPAFKQTKPLYTQGGEFLLEDTLTSYKGYYIKLANGDAYTGTAYARSTSKRLVTASIQDTQQQELVAIDYDIITQNEESLKLTRTLPLPSYIARRNDQDSEIQRFFAKSKVSGRIQEISRQTFLSLESRETTYHYPSYEILQINWYINSPVEDTVLGGYFVEGSIGKNKKQILQAERLMTGISQILSPEQLVV